MKRRALASSALVFVAALARAQTGDQALAQSLFDQGTQLAGAGNYEEACPKLAESQQLAPSGGTLITLGLCLEKAKKLAAAWSTFNEALAWALEDGNATREQIARDRIADLEPKLIRITIDVQKEARDIPGLDVTYDGAPIRARSWGVPAPTDSGAHLVVATAPGRVPWRLDIELHDDVSTRDVMVPVLAVEPTSEPPKVVVVTPPEKKKRSLVPWVLGGAGAVGLGIGIAGGIAAFAEHGAADGICKGSMCPQRAIDQESAANSAAWVSNVGFIVGGALVATAVVLYLVDTKRPRRVAFTF